MQQSRSWALQNSILCAPAASPKHVVTLPIADSYQICDRGESEELCTSAGASRGCLVMSQCAEKQCLGLPITPFALMKLSLTGVRCTVSCGLDWVNEILICLFNRHSSRLLNKFPGIPRVEPDSIGCLKIEPQRQEEIHEALGSERHYAGADQFTLRLIPKSGVNVARDRQIWPENGHLALTFLQQSIDLREAQLSSPEILAYERGAEFSLSTCEWGRSFQAIG
jgi:hypothetical protein